MLLTAALADDITTVFRLPLSRTGAAGFPSRGQVSRRGLGGFVCQRGRTGLSPAMGV